jgi:YesN/AraC family two-component response regulator
MADKILIIDDDPELRSELRDLLESYEVVEASSGEEALKILRKANEIGLVILDVMMPGASGIDVLGRIKKTDPKLNIIILTGHSSKDVAIEALKGRADDYIEKPPNARKITDAVERFLGEPSGQVSSLSSLSLKDKVEKVKRFIERNRYKKITLKEAANSVCLSPKYLSKIFTNYSKIGFTDYKLKVKIDAGKGLLRESGYNVDQISYKLGYENTESFIRQFKKITGKTPAGYRRQALRKKRR